MKTILSMSTTALLMLNSLCYAQTQESIAFNKLAKTCATNVHTDTMQALVRVESNFNPYAIGVVNGAVKQPRTLDEAIATAKSLFDDGKNFSLGLAQINVKNLEKYGLTFENVFSPCNNLKAASAILSECYSRADGDEQEALQKAFSCYYSGNFRTGFTQDLKGLPPYVERIRKASLQNADTATIRIPKLDPNVKVTVQSNTTAKVKTKAIALKAKSDTSTPIKTRAKWDAFGDW